MKKPIIFAIAVVSVLAATAGVLAATGSFSGRQNGSPVKDHYVITGTITSTKQSPGINGDKRMYAGQSNVDIRLRPGVYRFASTVERSDIYMDSKKIWQHSSDSHHSWRIISSRTGRTCAKYTYGFNYSGIFDTRRGDCSGALTLQFKNSWSSPLDGTVDTADDNIPVEPLPSVDWTLILERIHRFKD
ncbi:MAG: hypothetical protein OXE93_09190 [bacterium]|nr:hypothetical protein [bacterium]